MAESGLELDGYCCLLEDDPPCAAGGGHPRGGVAGERRAPPERGGGARWRNERMIDPQTAGRARVFPAREAAKQFPQSYSLDPVHCRRSRLRFTAGRHGSGPLAASMTVGGSARLVDKPPAMDMAAGWLQLARVHHERREEERI